MYTCDICGVDVLDPENLIRVWLEAAFDKQAILVCDVCWLEDTDTGSYLTEAEDDPTWDYGVVRRLD